ncbi:MAG TPA: hypothetical protein VGO57_07230 [Verrucomicrobiae bacterium]|jgi:hypothetical protein
MNLNTLTKTLLGAVLVAGIFIQAKAEDKKVDPTGSYVWTMPSRNGGPDHTNTLVLKLDGDKLTGKLVVPGRQGRTNSTDIADGKITGNDVSFTIVRKFNDNSMTNKYSGSLTNDLIKGKVEFTTRDGDAQSRDWEAKKQAETK